MKVQDVMTESVTSCAPETNLAEAVALMTNDDCGALPVLADGGEVVGIITDRDIAVATGIQDLQPSAIKVSDVMSTKVCSCAPEDDIHSALKSMRKHKIRRLPAIDEHGALRGILSIDDIVLHAEKVKSRKTGDLSYKAAMKALKAICERTPKVGRYAVAN